MRYVDHSDQAVKQIRARMIRGLQRVAFAGEGVGKRRAHVLTGNNRRGIHGVVIDENGRKVDGAMNDENGRATPDYPAIGKLRAVVGGNSNYSFYAELREQYLAAALVAMQEFARREFSNIGKG